MYEVALEETFCSAHSLRGYSGPCQNVHGHTFRARVELSGEKLDGLGMLVDFIVLKGKLREVLSELDHLNINDHPFFQTENPTAENLAKFIYLHMHEQFPVLINRVTVWESPEASASYYASS